MKETKPLFEDADAQHFEDPSTLKKPDPDKMARTLKRYINKKNKIIDKTQELLDDIPLNVR